MQDERFAVPIGLPVPNETVSLAEVADLGRQISASVQKTAAHFLETACLCDLGFQKYRTHGLPVLLGTADMSRSTFMKYVAIARDLRLRRIESLLPPSLTTIHQIVQLTDEEFDEAIRAEIIHPKVRRSEIEYLRKAATDSNKDLKKTSEPAPVLSELVPGARAEFVIPTGVAPDDCQQVRRALLALRRKYGVEILPIKDIEQDRSSSDAEVHR